MPRRREEWFDSLRSADSVGERLMNEGGGLKIFFFLLLHGARGQ